MAKRKQQFDDKISKIYQVTKILEKLRYECKVTLLAFAKFFHLANQRTVRDWELGFSRPPENRHRDRFIIYLLDVLKLRRDTAQFFQIWNDVMVEQWEWQELNHHELESLLPNSVTQLDIVTPDQPIRMAPRVHEYGLVGRDELVDTIKKQLVPGSSLALSGLPGVGKTVLAIQLANDPQVLSYFRGGVLWVPLGYKADVLSQLSRLGKVLNITPDDVGDPTDSENWASAIQLAISNKQLLLIIDDVWNIDAALYFKLGGANSAHLITTRFPEIATQFASDGEIKVPELSEDHGFKLLAKLAPTIVKSESDSAKELVKAVGSLPQALILMGNYLRKEGHSSQPRRILRALEELKSVEKRLQLKESQTPVYRHPSLPASAHISLDAVIALSDDVLDPASQRTLRAISVFPPKPNSFSEQAAKAVSAESVEILDNLYDFGLLESSGPGRYTLHQVISGYARIKLTDENSYKRMVDFFIDYVKIYEGNYDALDLEYTNVLAALEVAIDKRLQFDLMRGINALYEYLDTRGLYLSAEYYLRKGLETNQSQEESNELVTLSLNLGTVLRKLGQYTDAESYLLKVLPLAHKLEQHKSIVSLLQELGITARKRGNYAQAEKYYNDALEIARKLKDKTKISTTLLDIGALADYNGNFADAKMNYEEGLSLARETADKELIGEFLTNLGVLATSQCEYIQAEEHLRDGLALISPIGHKENICHILQNLGAVNERRGNYAQAKVYYDDALALAHRIKHPERIAFLLNNLGVLVFNEGNYKQAEEYWRESLALTEALGHAESMCYLLLNLGAVAMKAKELEKAEQYWTQGLNIIHTIKLDIVHSVLLTNIAEVKAAQDNTEESETFLEQGITLARNSKQLYALIIALTTAGELRLKRQAVKSAAEAFHEAADLAKKMDSQEYIAKAFYGKAQIAKIEGDIRTARELGQEALAIFHSLKHQMEDEVRQWFESVE